MIPEGEGNTINGEVTRDIRYTTRQSSPAFQSVIGNISFIDQLPTPGQRKAN